VQLNFGGTQQKSMFWRFLLMGKPDLLWDIFIVTKNWGNDEKTGNICYIRVNDNRRKAGFAFRKRQGIPAKTAIFGAAVIHRNITGNKTYSIM